MWVRRLLAGLRMLFLSRRVERELDEEMATHLAMAAEEQMRRGVRPDEAWRAARRSFGMPGSVKEAHRQTNSLYWLDATLQDVRYGLRTLRRDRGFTIVAVLTLALAIGANTAIFSLVNGVLLTPLPVADDGRIVVLGARSEQGFDISVSIPNYDSWAQANRVFESAGGLRSVTLTLTGRDEPERVVAKQVLGDVFGVSGRQPILGRMLRPDETLRGSGRLAVLGYGLWTRRFGSDPAVVGTRLVLDGEPYEVIGVMPEHFGFEMGTDLWVPMGADPTLPWDSRGDSSGMYVVARLRPGVTLADARADMERVGLAVRDDTGYTGMPTVTSLRELLLGDVRPALYVLLGAVGFVLLIACVTIANLLLARAEARQGETAVRAALGAGRGRLVRQLLTESALIAALGGTLGLAFASSSLRVLASALPLPVPMVDRITIDWRVLVFTAGVSVATGLLFGLAPAWRLSRAALARTLGQAGHSSVRTGDGRLRRALVVSEVALAVVLLVGAGLMIKSFSRLTTVDPGFRTEDVVSMQISLPDSAYPDTEAWIRFFDRLLDRTHALPGVVSASVSNLTPMLPYSTEATVRPGTGMDYGAVQPSVLFQAVGSTYFDTLRIPLLRGRTFTRQDDGSGPQVAIVDRSLAEAFWPGQDPIGRRLSFEVVDHEPVWREVVGVVGHVRHYGLRTPSRIQIYVPYTQPPVYFANRRQALTLFVRSEADSAGIIAAVRREVRALDANLPVFNEGTLDEVVSASTGRDRLLSALLTAFAGAALLLAAIGLYGVIAHAVLQRTREIGVRVALGAPVTDVLSLVLRQAVRLTVVGLVAGLAAAWMLSSSLAAVLFEVSTGDPATYATIAFVLVVTACLAAYLPARRAARIDPAAALRP